MFLTASTVAAQSAITKTAPFQLQLRVYEREIRDGELRTVLINRNYTLPPRAVLRSRNFSKVSTALEPALTDIFQSLNRTPQDAVWYQQGSGWLARQRSAWVLDETATRAQLLEALIEGRNFSPLVVEVKSPSRSVESWYKQGIRYRFGGGESAFYNSAPFRVQNIRVGSALIDGVTILPNDVFDFNATVGNISPERGFVDGYVIKTGTLVKEVGGGICQVSTTVWRAAYLSGLPIVQRNFHSYRVGYYELASPNFRPSVGFEATVYAPYKNLKFRNDTGSSIFIQISVQAYTMQVNFFGAKPDRRIRITAPTFGVRKPALPPRYQADASVPLGKQRQIDRAVDGLSVWQNRTVLYANGGVRKDRLYSNYVAWGAIIAVNPNDLRLKPKLNSRIP